jgi:hypothetical protein
VGAVFSGETVTVAGRGSTEIREKSEAKIGAEEEERGDKKPGAT